MSNSPRGKHDDAEARSYDERAPETETAYTSVELVRSICRPTPDAAIVSNPERADPKRADHSFTPNALKAAIIIQ